jgi:hypothetical protein
MEYPKGRYLVARVLRRMFGSGHPVGGRAQGMRVLLAVLRNARAMFGDNVRAEPLSHGDVVVAEEDQHVLAAVEVAKEASGAIMRMKRADDLIECCEALQDSDLVEEMQAVPPDGGVPHLVDLLELKRQIVA